MSNEVVNRDTQSAIEWTGERLELLKRTICKDATNDEFSLFIEVAKRSGLNPFARQIHAVKRSGKMTIQTGIDGYRLIADRTGKYAGSDDPIFDNEKQPTKATVTVYKIVQGVRCAFTATARWDEYYPGESQGFMWKKMPCVMLGKCAESLALRKAFPAELSGLYTNEEMDQADRGGVYPEQPGPNDGFSTPGYHCSHNLRKAFPALSGRPISKCDPTILRDAITGIESKAKNTGKEIPAWAVEFIENAEPLVAAWENEQPQNPDALDLEPGSDG